MEIIKNFKNLFIIILLCLSYSCDKNFLNECVEGEFIIEKVKYKNYNLKLLLDLNIMTFYSNGNVKLPSVFNYDENITGDTNVDGKWSISTEEKKIYLVIKSNNKYFNGRYSVKFEKDDTRKAFIMLLSNDSTTLNIVKNDLNYTANESKINKAIRISN